MDANSIKWIGFKRQNGYAIIQPIATLNVGTDDKARSKLKTKCELDSKNALF